MGMMPRTRIEPQGLSSSILPRRRIQVINIVSRKGGAGKTTMALLAARYLACKESAPLVTLFDLDFSGTSLDDALDPRREKVGEDGTTAFEQLLADDPGAPGWEAGVADALRWYEMPGTESGMLYAASADKKGTSERLLLSGRRARDLVRARLRRLVRWVVEQYGERRDFVFLLDNSPGVRGLSRDLLHKMLDVKGAMAPPPPEVQWADVFVTTPDRQDVLATFSAWLAEWDQKRGQIAGAGRLRSEAEAEAADKLLFLVNKMREEDGDVDQLLRSLLPVVFAAEGYGEREIQRLIDEKLLKIARCSFATDLALLFRGVQPVRVPPLETYVPGLGSFLDALMPAPAPQKAAPVLPGRKRSHARRLDEYFVRNGRIIDLEPAEDGIAICADFATRGLSTPLWAELEKRGLYRTVGLERSCVEVYQLPRGSSAEALTEELGRRADVRYANKVYRHDPALPEDVLVLTDQFMVRFKPDLTPSKIAGFAERRGFHLAETIEDMPGGYLGIVKSGCPNNALKICNQLVQDDLVIFAEPDWVHALTSRGAPRTRLTERDQWHFSNFGQSGGKHGADAGVFSAWLLDGKRKRVNVAIIDIAIDIDHPQLDRRGKLAPALDVELGTPDPRPRHGERHGTAVAGVALAARTGGKHRAPAGAAPDARLIAIRNPVLTRSSYGARAFRYARKQGADIVICSWGPQHYRGRIHDIPPVVAYEIDLLVTEGRGGLGTPVFFAAGNGRESTETDGYASYHNVIAVAASDHDDIRMDHSDFGPAIWVCAPSAPPGGIVTLAPGGGHRDDFDGNSAACPIVAGVAALMLKANPRLTWLEVKEILASTADRIDPEGRTFKDRFGQTHTTRYGEKTGHSVAYGHGRVNAEKAVNEALRRRTMTPAATRSRERKKA